MRFFFPLLLSWAFCSVSFAQQKGIFQRLEAYPDLTVQIETDIALLKQSKEEDEWQPGMLTLLTQGKSVSQMAVKVSTRGKMRKKICEFPPVKIKFEEEEHDPKDTSGEWSALKLKIVMPCSAASAQPDLVMRECLVYQLYNTLTEASFRVKPAHIAFRDPRDTTLNFRGQAFFIESEKELAARLQGRTLKPKVIIPQIMDGTAYDRMCLFQYMIGNTDWDAYHRHNVKVELLQEKYVTAVPYDFDYSGLVNAVYARPADNYQIKSVRERYFRGLCRPAGTYEAAAQHFLAQKAAILAKCDAFDHLSMAAKTEMKAYLQSFFAILESPETFQREIVLHCGK